MRAAQKGKLDQPARNFSRSDQRRDAHVLARLAFKPSNSSGRCAAIVYWSTGP